VPYDPTIYLGSAAHYRYGRPAYSPELEAAMLAEGCRAAGEKGVTNIRWVRGLAEDLPAVAPGPYKLVTFGQSFHWTDEQHVAETVYDMLEPGGALALIVHVPRQLFVPGIPDLLRDSESVLSGYLSLSFSAPHLFGDRLDDFADEVRTLLASRCAEGISGTGRATPRW
jgi:ubiquinone/menaquinone biosynthesis C-methylase UbiE